jgi:hypothetical protein
MKLAEPESLARRPDLETPISVEAESGNVLGGKQTVPQGFRVPAVHKGNIARLRLVWVRRKFLACVGACALLFCSWIVLMIPVRYQCVARLMPPDNQSGSGLAMAAAALAGSSGGGLGGTGGLAGEFLGQKSSSELLVGVLTSRTVADRLIERFDLRKAYGNRWIEDTRKHLAAWTDISVDRKSQIITVKVTDKSPRRATALAQPYVDELNRALADVSTSSARRERIFLEDRLLSTRI